MDSSGSIPYDLFSEIAVGVRDALKVGLCDGQRRDYAVINFSDRTLFTGWVPKTRFKELIPIMLTYQQAGSYLDTKMLEKLGERKEKFAALMLTDGTLQNIKEVIPALAGLSKKGNQIALLYTNDREPLPKDLACMEDFANIFQLTNDKEINKRIIAHYTRDALTKP